ncbi:MAG: protein-glutamate O-methyltransferase CheR [Acidobacteria bacterium]|nr:protein-glutamate O-methyltransferase CheR [Acidobacteriota bacterium]
MIAQNIFSITDQEFSLFQDLIYKKSGIFLSESKKALLLGRLSKRLQILNLTSFSAYYRYVTKINSSELVELLNRICTNETHFFREHQHFDFLEKKVFPDFINRAGANLMPQKIRVWSAGCSSGEEPYSLAMSLLAYFSNFSGWDIEILATDLSTYVLEKAQKAVWPIEKTKEIPDKYLKRFMLKGINSQAGKIKASKELVSIIDFQQLNLNDNTYKINGLFDMIFCRNVLIYFRNDKRIEVINRLLNYLSPSGYLFLGHSESLQKMTEQVRSVIPTVYVNCR